MVCSSQVDLGNGTVYIEWAMGCQEPGCNAGRWPDGHVSPGGMFLVSATTPGSTASWLASPFGGESLKFNDDAATQPPPNLGHSAASRLVLPPCVGGACTEYAFDKAQYHVANSGDKVRFPRKDIHIVNGTLLPGGGDISLHSANGTFPDTMIRFGPAENISKYLTHTRNMSTTLAGKRFHGRAVFIDSPKAFVHEMEQMLWYTPPPVAPGIDPIVGEVIIGPNPLGRLKRDDTIVV